jgi:hypothetical protein
VDDGAVVVVVGPVVVEVDDGAVVVVVGPIVVVVGGVVVVVVGPVVFAVVVVVISISDLCEGVLAGSLDSALDAGGSVEHGADRDGLSGRAHSTILSTILDGGSGLLTLKVITTAIETETIIALALLRKSFANRRIGRIMLLSRSFRARTTI